VSDGFFETARIPLLAGRDFSRQEAFDRSARPVPVVLNQLAARHFFGDGNPVGRTLESRWTDRVILAVVGVVGDVRTPTSAAEPAVYVPFAFQNWGPRAPYVIVRSALSLQDTGDLVQAHARAMDGSVPMIGPRPLSEWVAGDLATQRVLAWVLTVLGCLGLCLAAIGIGGLVAQFVGERRREIGIRIALGATRADVFALVGRPVAQLALMGTVAGVGLAAGGTRLVQAHLVGISAGEPWAYAASTGALLLALALAAVWPARAATRIEPVEALRAE
jgi:hypothetical protein